MTSLDWRGTSSLEQVKNGLEVLRHRGPNGGGLWRSPGGHMTLGHRRLSVMDLAAGAQPIANEDGCIHCVVNGEFYDFERIRKELESLGHCFRTHSDSEILIHLYEEFGLDCLHYLRGEFAFVLWDERTRMLFAARDRFGIKPLFFSEAGNKLLFASEIKALHAAGIPAAWDTTGYWEKLVLCYPLQGRTLFGGIKEVSPAHYFIARNGEWKLHRYWDFDYPRLLSAGPDRSDAEYAEQLEAVLKDAVQTRLRADVPVACYLSGGIDSASITALMSHFSIQPTQAFCLTFDDPAYDERTLAQETAECLGATFTPVPVRENDLAAHLEQSVWHGETVFNNAQCVAKFLLSRAVRDSGFSVVLTGEGADEVFAGYPAFVLDTVFSERARPCSPESPSLSAFSSRLGYSPAWHQGQQEFLAPLRETLPGSFERGGVLDRFLDSLDIQHQMKDRSILDQSLYLYNRTVLPGHILTVMGDRMEMAHSIEARLPFLDHKVVEFSRSLPATQKVRGFAEKFVLRKSMHLHLPDGVCRRRKQALQTPPFLCTKGPLQELLQDTLRGSALNRVPFLDKPGVKRLLDSGLTADLAISSKLEGPLMAMLTTCLLGEQFRL